MKTKLNLLILWAILARLLAPDNALAFYNPAAGRWLNRDPAQERGGPNLYAFVRNEGCNHVDVLGLRADHCDDPCGQAKRQGLDIQAGAHDTGGVICCSGVKYFCVWDAGGMSGATHPKAQTIISKCIEEHEKDHADDINCPKIWCRGFPTRPGFKPGKNPDQEECKAYSVGQACLTHAMAACEGDIDCETQIGNEITEIAAKIVAHCFK